MAAKFTKKHFEAIADVLNDLHDPNAKDAYGKPLCLRTLHTLEGKLSRLFAKDSPRYDKRKFYGRIDKGRGI